MTISYKIIKWDHEKKELFFSPLQYHKSVIIHRGAFDLFLVGEMDKNTHSLIFVLGREKEEKKEGREEGEASCGKNFNSLTVVWSMKGLKRMEGMERALSKG